MTGVLGDLEPIEEVAESESDSDTGGSNDILAAISKENKGEDDTKNKLLEQGLVLISEEGGKEKVQVILQRVEQKVLPLRPLPDSFGNQRAHPN